MYYEIDESGLACQRKTKVNKKLQEAAQKLLKLLGKNGEHWLNGNESDGAGNFCLIGGLDHLGYDQELFDPVLPLRTPLNSDHDEYDSSEIIDDFEIPQFQSTPDFNDRDGFRPVQKFLKLVAKGVDPSEVYIDTKGSAEKVVITKKVIKLK